MELYDFVPMDVVDDIIQACEHCQAIEPKPAGDNVSFSLDDYANHQLALKRCEANAKRKRTTEAFVAHATSHVVDQRWPLTRMGPRIRLSLYVQYVFLLRPTVALRIPQHPVPEWRNGKRTPSTTTSSVVSCSWTMKVFWNCLNFFALGCWLDVAGASGASTSNRHPCGKIRKSINFHYP